MVLLVFSGGRWKEVDDMSTEITKYLVEGTAERIAAYARVLVKMHRQKHITTE